MTTTPTRPDMVREVWETVVAAHTTAKGMGGTYRFGDGTEWAGDSLTLSSAQGAITAFMNNNGARLFVRGLQLWVILDITNSEVINFDKQKPTEVAALRTLLGIMSGAAIIPAECVPYGVVEDGVVTAITFTTPLRTEDAPHSHVSREKIGLNNDTYVVRCNDDIPRRPSWMTLTANNDEALRQWYARFWQEVQHGNVIRLSDRIRQHPGEMWAVNPAEGTTWLEFSVSDGLQSVLVTGQPYQMWDIAEAFPGQLYQNPREGGPVRNPLRTWFE